MAELAGLSGLDDLDEEKAIAIFLAAMRAITATVDVHGEDFPLVSSSLTIALSTVLVLAGQSEDAALKYVNDAMPHAFRVTQIRIDELARDEKLRKAMH